MRKLAHTQHKYRVLLTLVNSHCIEFNANQLKFSENCFGGAAAWGILAIPPFLHGRLPGAKFGGEQADAKSVLGVGGEALAGGANGLGEDRNLLGSLVADRLHDPDFG